MKQEQAASSVDESGIDLQDVEMGKYEVDPDDEKIMYVKGEEEWRGHRSIDGIPITPFNLKEENLEGAFDSSGMFVWHKREAKDRHLDAWYDEYLEKQNAKIAQNKGREEVAPETANDSDDEREERAEQQRRMREKAKARRVRELKEAQQLRDEKKSKQLFASLERESGDKPDGDKADGNEDDVPPPPPESESESEVDEDEEESDPDLRAANRRDREAKGKDDKADIAAGPATAAIGHVPSTDEEGSTPVDSKDEHIRTELRRKLLQYLLPGECVYDAMRRLKREVGCAPTKGRQDRPEDGSLSASGGPAPLAAATATIHTKRQRDDEVLTTKPQEPRKRGRTELEELIECADRLFQLDYFGLPCTAIGRAFYLDLDAYTDKRERVEHLVEMDGRSASSTVSSSAESSSVTSSMGAPSSVAASSSEDMFS